MSLVKSESQALTKINDGEVSILDAMENLVKVLARGGLPGNYFEPTCSELLTLCIAEGTVAAVSSQIFK
jgi:hypothetical protein